MADTEERPQFFLPADVLNRFGAELREETDRAAAILGAAYLDDRLKELLWAKFVGSENDKKRLLGTDRPLGTFGARIGVARAVGLISDNVANDLGLIQKIRNRFAHDLHLSFATPDIADRCLKLRAPSAMRTSDGEEVVMPPDPRMRFNVAVAILLTMGVEARIRSMPAFSEPHAPETITLEPIPGDH